MKFFLAYIMLPVFGQVCNLVRFDICRNGRHRAGVRCHDLIPFYQNCYSYDRADSRIYLYSLFTRKELDQVKRFFYKRFGYEVTVEEMFIPRPCRSKYPAWYEASGNGIYCEKITINPRLKIFVTVHYDRMSYECGPDYYDPECVITDDDYGDYGY